MNTTIIGKKRVSELALGCAKMLELDDSQGHDLIKTAVNCGINCFDAHRRYGNAERILKSYPEQKDLFYMTKVSAYLGADFEEYLNKSIEEIGRIDLLWISDLDDKRLYNQGLYIYDEIVWKFENVGITTENPFLATRFIDTHPECKFLMMPIFIGQDEIVKVAEYAQEMGIMVFAIKPFDDGRLFVKGYSVKDCLDFLKGKADVVVFGSKDVEHIKEVVNTWE